MSEAVAAKVKNRPKSRYANSTQQINFRSKMTYWQNRGYTMFRDSGREACLCKPTADSFEFLTITLLPDGLILEDLNVVRTEDIKTLIRHAESMKTVR